MRERLLRFLRPDVFVPMCLAIYAGAAALSLIVAHVLLIVKPNSGLGQRIIAPIAGGIAFLDAHWRTVLILIATPFFIPVMQDLIRRVRKIYGFEFDPVQIEPQGVREKPGD
jgi:hypothetical protein